MTYKTHRNDSLTDNVASREQNIHAYDVLYRPIARDGMNAGNKVVISMPGREHMKCRSYAAHMLLALLSAV